MNIDLPYIPERSFKPRKNGITMIMDKGLSLRETENCISSSEKFTDFAKIGFGTAVITNNLEEKIKLYKEANIRPYFGGTLFEAFIVRNMFNDFRRILDKFMFHDVSAVSQQQAGAVQRSRVSSCLSRFLQPHFFIEEMGVETGNAAQKGHTKKM